MILITVVDFVSMYHESEYPDVFFLIPEIPENTQNYTVTVVDKSNDELNFYKVKPLTITLYECPEATNFEDVREMCVIKETPEYIEYCTKYYSVHIPWEHCGQKKLQFVKITVETKKIFK